MTIPENLVNQLESKRRVMSLFIDILTGDNREVGLEALRDGFVKNLQEFSVSPSVTTSNINMNGVPGICVTPESYFPGQSILYAHGGAFIAGHPKGYISIAAEFAIRTKSKVFIPDYRLLPEHEFPAPIEDFVSSYEWLLAQTERADNKIAFVGDGAGGAMVISSMVEARNRSLALPLAAAVMSPWVDLTNSGPSMISRQARDLIHMDTPNCWDVMANFILKEKSKKSAVASPIFADLRDLPPTMIQVGEAEQLLSDAMTLAQKLTEYGVRSTLEVWPEVYFGWQMYHAEFHDADKAVTSMAQFINTSFD